MKYKKDMLIFGLLFTICIMLFFVNKSLESDSISKEYNKKNTLSSSQANPYVSEIKKEFGNRLDDYIYVDDILYNFFEEVNNKNFEAAYSMLDEIYLQNSQIIFETFKDIYDFDIDKTVVINNFTKKEDEYIIEVLITDNIGNEVSKYNEGLIENMINYTITITKGKIVNIPFEFNNSN